MCDYFSAREGKSWFCVCVDFSNNSFIACVQRQTNLASWHEFCAQFDFTLCADFDATWSAFRCVLLRSLLTFLCFTLSFTFPRDAASATSNPLQNDLQGFRFNEAFFVGSEESSEFLPVWWRSLCGSMCARSLFAAAVRRGEIACDG